MSALIWLNTTNIALFVYVCKNLSCINVTSGIKLRYRLDQSYVATLKLARKWIGSSSECFDQGTVGYQSSSSLDLALEHPHRVLLTLAGFSQ